MNTTETHTSTSKEHPLPDGLFGAFESSAAFCDIDRQRIWEHDIRGPCSGSSDLSLYTPRASRLCRCCPKGMRRN